MFSFLPLMAGFLVAAFNISLRKLRTYAVSLLDAGEVRFVLETWP
jgi:hypothetical protein